MRGKGVGMEVAILQVWQRKDWSDEWIIVGVFANKELAEQEASLRGYTRWSVSEFGVMGGNNA